MHSVLVVGFNVRPLAYSLHTAGYKVYAVDFFGDLDLFPYVEEAKIILDELGTQYKLMKDIYPEYLAHFAIDMLNKYDNIDYLLIGSGLDDAFEERQMIQDYITESGYNLRSLNNEINLLKKARDIFYVYNILSEKGFKFPKTFIFDENLVHSSIDFPFILKRAESSGGISILKCENKDDLDTFLKMQHAKNISPNDYLIQEYIEGIDVSCTTISDGKQNHVISINKQILGEKFLNAPKDFIYCGNVVPANILQKDRDKIRRISQFLTSELGLKGIIGFDYVLHKHEAFLMEINPRIPGSIWASEKALDLNLLDLHVKCYAKKSHWPFIRKKLKKKSTNCFATKLIFFAPQTIKPKIIRSVNDLPYVHDKTPPKNKILKGDPICTIMHTGNKFAESYFAALKKAENINRIIKEKYNLSD
ncbi:MAG: ATP-grasp domain-containing protein [Promethearchaeia archaeon]